LAERGLSDLERRYTEFARPVATLLDVSDLDGQALQALALPDPRQVEAWRTELSAVDRRIADHAERRRELVTRQKQLDAQILALRGTGGLIEDAEAMRLRQARDAAWAAHLALFDKASAESFEAAMRADDLASAARLAAMRDLADLRGLTQEFSLTTASIARQQELLDEAEAERETLCDALRAALPQGLLKVADDGFARLFSRIDAITRTRADALAAWDRLEATKREIEQARADAEIDRETLAAALGAAGLGGDTASLAEMVETADAAVAGHAVGTASRAAADKAMADLERALSDRQSEFETASIAAADWQTRFAAALGGTWFHEATSAGAVREILETLDRLGPALHDRDELARRITLMERDRDDFATEVRSLLSDLGESGETDAVDRTAATLAARLDMARRDQALKADKAIALERLAHNERALRQDLAEHAARKAQLTEFFQVETLADVAIALDQAKERDRQETRLRELAAQILSNLPAPAIEAALGEVDATDFEAVEREGAELAARLGDLDGRTHQLFAEKTSAADRLEAIGGGSEVARIEAEKRTIFLEIEDLADTYLRLKSGALVAAEALRAYRDKHRSSMMKRASEAFRLITRGDYVGLAAQPDKDRETLIGLTRQGGSKLAGEMSKGTRFQLYLALRLAGYDEFAASRPAVPFIADDIMETFDEPRSEEVLRLFGEMAKIGQVVYLTHHRHLCDLARRIVPEVRVHELAG